MTIERVMMKVDAAIGDRCHLGQDGMVHSSVGIPDRDYRYAASFMILEAVRRADVIEIETGARVRFLRRIERMYVKDLNPHS